MAGSPHAGFECRELCDCRQSRSAQSVGAVAMVPHALHDGCTLLVVAYVRWPAEGYSRDGRPAY